MRKSVYNFHAKMLKQILSVLFGERDAALKQTDHPGRLSPVQSGGPDAAAALTMMSRYLGILKVLGDRDYQSVLSAAKGTTADERPVFMATLVPGTADHGEPHPVSVVIEGFGQIGYLPPDAVNGYSARITGNPAVRCPVHLRGTAPSIEAVVDLARSEGARLTAWRPDDHYDYDAHARFHAMRRPVLDTLQQTRMVERSDLETAIARYRVAIDAVRQHEHFAVEHNLFALIKPGTHPKAVEVLDRLTLCLVRAERHHEAVAEADRYFADFPAARDSVQVEAIQVRVDRARTAST